MRKPGVFPAVEEAVQFVETRLGSGDWKQGDLLPAISNLAGMVGVSRGTMIRAISELRKRGLVHGTQRSRLRLGNSIAPLVSRESPTKKWQRHRLQFEKDILAGAFGLHGTLPLLKELQNRYGVSFETMRKIADAMVDDGVLKLRGKRYALPDITGISTRKRIVFITCVGHAQQLSALNSAHNHIVNMFESECIRAGVCLDIEEIDIFDATKSRRASSRLVDKSDTIGYILDVWWYPLENIRRAYLDILDRITRFSKPIAILDEISGFSLPIEHTRNPLLQVYGIESARGAERIARFLLGLGHRTIAYLSLIHQAIWSQQRLNGLSAQFERAGLAAHVHLIQGKNLSILLPALLTQSGLDDDVVRKLITVSNTPSQAKDLTNRWKEFTSTHQPPYPEYPQFDKTICNNLSILAALVRQPNQDPLIFERMVNGAFDAISRKSFEIDAKPLFEQALKNRKITAWVCANDTLAFSALAFLKDKGIHVPGNISVVGFDNVPVAAFELRLTTLDFNAMGFIHRMLGFILRPPKPRGEYRHHSIEVEAIIIERNTTGKAKI
jgi:hypothetical protein